MTRDANELVHGRQARVDNVVESWISRTCDSKCWRRFLVRRHEAKASRDAYLMSFRVFLQTQVTGVSEEHAG